MLDARLVADVLLDECPACGGAWLDTAAVERIIKERRQASASAIMGIVAPHTAAAVPASGGRLYVKCPDCEQVMNRVNFGRRSGVIVDVCRAHGTWFDADELPRVVDFVMSGGLEESERRQMEELREEVRRERSRAEAERVAAGMRGGPLDSGDGVVLFGGLLEVLARKL